MAPSGGPPPHRKDHRMSHPAWDAAWRDLGLAAPAASVFDEVAARYAEPHRAYHTMRHIEECFAQFDRARHLCAHPGEVAVALWFHDAIYDPRREDNEALSAEWAARVLADAGEDVAARVGDLILATRHDAPPPAGDASVLVDIDLTILAAGTRRFDEYERDIRFEYAWVPDDAFREGRAKVLRAFLDRPSIYATSWFSERCESAARANLGRSLARLGGS
jgi:predicted metal-dependent HD superfamily phosphohydrolase